MLALPIGVHLTPSRVPAGRVTKDSRLGEKAETLVSSSTDSFPSRTYLTQGLSEEIVKADGTPAPHLARAHQYQITSAPNGGKFFSDASLKNKTLYSTLPPPDVGGVGAVSPYIGILSLPGGDPGLPPQDQFLFGTGGTGLSFTLGPDTRITNVNALPPGPFQMTGANMPFDAFTGDTIHQYFQMVQQMDCAIDEQHVSRRNPTGCLHDLQSAVTTTF